MHTWRTRYGWQTEQWPRGEVQNPTGERRSGCRKSMRRARQGDLNAFVPNNLFFALPATNRSGLLGRQNQSLTKNKKTSTSEQSKFQLLCSSAYGLILYQQQLLVGRSNCCHKTNLGRMHLQLHYPIEENVN